ncbi:MAG: glutamate--tRNA ligase [Alphaproteobacteria bacterium]
MEVITRFAPSPTGYLHIGSARTAIFNYLFAKHHNGKFLLRIEDTDRARSTKEAIDALVNGLKWLELNWDGEEIYQFSRAARHKEVAEHLVNMGKAYYCYQTQEETEAAREKAKAEGKQYQYDRKWRNTSITPPANVKPTIRLKANYEGNTILKDLVQGEISFPNSQIDDMVLLRSDGTPTYMLAVVVDDHDMNITHIIRGDDHLTNAARQIQIYEAMGWKIPEFAHIPLIHGSDGAKLSKRHGALGIEAYKDMGYLPEALNNYLLRLGWSHGDDEIISHKQAIEWFNLESVGKSPSRIDFKKLENVNAHYIKISDNKKLARLIQPLIEKEVGFEQLTESQISILEEGIEDLKPRVKTITELANSAIFYIKEIPVTEELRLSVNQSVDYYLKIAVEIISSIDVWNAENIEQKIKNFVEEHEMKFSDLGQALRVVLTGSKSAPGIFKIIKILGKKVTIERINTWLNYRSL